MKRSQSPGSECPARKRTSLLDHTKLAELHVETKLGIQTYLSTHVSGFDGIIKHRYEDFKVTEIDVSGSLVQMPEFDINPFILAEEDAFDHESALDRLKQLLHPSDSEFFAKIQDKTCEPFISNESYDCKEIRSQIHKVLRGILDLSGLQSSTNESKKIVISPAKTRAQKGGLRKSGPGEKYLLLAMYKVNLETMATLAKLAKRLRIPASSLCVSGTKDRRAVTVQHVTCKKIDPNLIVKAIPATNNFRVAVLGFRKSPLKLGELKGNRFEVVIRSIKPKSPESLASAVERSFGALKSRGFVNYFGLQRFGTSSVGSWEIGVAMIQKNWRNAVKLVLDPRLSDPEEIKTAREKWLGCQVLDDLKDVKELFPCYAVAERALLSGDPFNDPEGAFMLIPERLKSMYLHSFQSLIWNKACTERLEMSKEAVLLGDLVQISDSEEVVFVTEANIGEFKINQIVLPLPGFKVFYPKNLQNYYEKLLAQFGFTFESFKCKNDRTLNLPGSYRPIICIPKNTKYEFIESDACRFEFDLPPSCYATMLLRELMRVETSSSAQTLKSQSIDSNEIFLDL